MRAVKTFNRKINGKVKGIKSTCIAFKSNPCRCCTQHHKCQLLVCNRLWDSVKTSKNLNGNLCSIMYDHLILMMQVACSFSPNGEYLDLYLCRCGDTVSTFNSLKGKNGFRNSSERKKKSIAILKSSIRHTNPTKPAILLEAGLDWEERGGEGRAARNSMKVRTDESADVSSSKLPDSLQCLSRRVNQL